MKIISNNTITELGNSGMRCAHWCIKIKKTQTLKKLGWHEGKYYAYMYCLKKVGWAEILVLNNIKNPNKFLKKFYRGKWILFPNLKWNIIVIMKDKYFKKCLYAKQPENTNQLQKEMKKMCKKI